VLFATHLAAAAAVGLRTRLAMGWLVAGAALPDLVDKPLASVGVVDLFHSVGHSALVLALAAVIVVVAGWDGPRVRAVAVGWASHLFLDAFHIVVNGRADDALFLGWPVTEPATPLGIPPGEFIWYYLWSPSFFVEIGIWAAFGWLLLTRVRA
jgi:hypothetical protein